MDNPNLKWMRTGGPISGNLKHLYTHTGKSLEILINLLVDTWSTWVFGWVGYIFGWIKAL
jgi:hypothetical protein